MHTHVSLFLQAFGFFAMVAFGALAGFMVYIIIAQYMNKSTSSDPSSDNKEDPAEPTK